MICFKQIHPNFSCDILKLLITSVALRTRLLLLFNPNEKKIVALARWIVENDLWRIAK